MRRAVALGFTFVLAACGQDAAKPPKRTGSGTVEYVDQPILIDGGKSTGTTDEVEPNDGEDTATKLALGATLRGKIDAEGDVDHFAIDVAATGVLAVDVSPIESFDLNVELLDATGTSLVRSDRGGVKVREGLPNVAVAAGRYTVVVRAKKLLPPVVKLKKDQKAGQKPPPPPASSVAFPSPVYEITANVTPPATGAFEREPDDDRGAANDLILGDAVQGYLGWTGDVDTWKLSLETLSSKNAIDVEVTSPEGLALTLEIADGLGNPLVTRKAPRGAGLIVRGFVPVIAQGAAPYHYLTLRADRSNPETAYQLKVTEHVVGPDAELEPDDTPEKAMAMPSDRTSVKGVWTTADVDCYVLETTDAVRTLEVTLDTPNEVDLALEVLVDGKPVAKSDIKGKGAAEKVSTSVPASGRPVIRVRAADPNATGEGAYTLTVQEPSATP
ncbi:MAG: hypothetical protein NT062_36160 [Proteobacteria bacterium]|nr:hypothetical protein [Pseudomonadota bacterium]